MFEGSFLSNPDRAVPHCHAPSICQLSSGTILVAWYAYPNIETESGTLILIRKGPESSTWEPARRILPEFKSTLANPVLFEDGEGALWLMFVTLRGHYWDSAIVMASRSEDEGQVWSTPQVVVKNPGMMVRHPPLMRGDLSMILPAYDERTNETVLLSHTPSTPTWTEGHRFTLPKVIQACLVGESISKWTLIFRPVGEQRTCYRAVSGDEGRTWSPVIQTSLPNPLSGVAAFESNGALCVVHNHTDKHQRFPLSLCYSTDRGVSWSAAKHIDTAKHEVSYPSFLVDRRGVVHGVYTYDRRLIKYVCFDENWWRS